MGRNSNTNSNMGNSNMDSGSIVAIHHNSTLLDNETEQLSDVAINIKRKENDK